MKYPIVALSILTAGTTSWIQPAFAGEQNAPSGANAAAGSVSASSGDVADIVVTAQRRSENVQNVNIAVTALSGDALSEKQISRQLDLQTATPGLSIVKSGLTESVNIRGIGLASGSPQVTNGVTTYLDGIFQTPTLSGAQYYDLAGIEVLRGPQGTLSGANSTGGAIYINTNKPRLGEFGGSATVSGGNYNNFSANGAINLPITSTLALRVAALANTRDSYYTDLGPARDHPDRLSEHDGRAQLLWKPGKFEALAKFELIRRNTGGYAYQPIATTQYSAARTGIPWTVDYNSPTFNYERGEMASLELKYVFDGGLTLRSLSGYYSKRINNLYDVDGSPTASLTEKQFVGGRQWSQEVNVISPDTGPFTYVVGGYGARNKINVRIANAVNGTPTTFVEPDTNKLLVGAFGQATYKLTDRWEVEAGLRYSHFLVDGTGGVYIRRGAPGLPPLGINVAPQTGSENDGRVTGKVAVNFKPDDDNLLYAFVARGYKNGGINPPGGKFAPETVIDYEAGWKSTFFDRHLRTQIGAFYNSYDNFQEDVTNPSSGQNGVTNLANAKVKGFEGSFQGKLGEFSLDGSVSYVDSSLSGLTVINKFAVPGGISVPNCTGGATPPACYNYPFVTTTGGSNLYSPKWSWNLGAQYRIAASRTVDIVPRVNYSYIGSQWAYVTYSPATDLIPSRGLLTASVSVDFKRFTVEAYGTNLTNKYYVIGQSGTNEFYGAPREYGVRVSANF